MLLKLQKIKNRFLQHYSRTSTPHQYSNVWWKAHNRGTVPRTHTTPTLRCVQHVARVLCRYLIPTLHCNTFEIKRSKIDRSGLKDWVAYMGSFCSISGTTMKKWTMLPRMWTWLSWETSPRTSLPVTVISFREMWYCPFYVFPFLFLMWTRLPCIRKM